MTTTFKVLGDVHLGKVFVNNVPLHRGVITRRSSGQKFQKRLDPKGAEVHVNMGDLYDKPFVPYGVVWCSAQLYLNAARAHPNTTFIVLRGNHDASRDLEAVSAFDIFEGLVAPAENIRCVKDWFAHDELVFFGWHPVTCRGRDRRGLRPPRTRTPKV